MINKNISIIIHTFNDEKNIVGCIKSANLLSDKVIAIDMESSDKTVDLTEKNGAVAYSFPKSNYVEPAREFGISKVDSNWVLILDSDERMTAELANEIKKVIDAGSHSGLSKIDSGVPRRGGVPRITPTHYKIPRKNIFGKVKWLKHGGWWPDYQIRLINKKYFRSWPKPIHSFPVISGNLGFLGNPILHYFHGDLESMVGKTIVFEDIESDLLFKAQKNVNTLTFFRKFMGELYRTLIRNLGFLDGELGIIELI